MRAYTEVIAEEMGLPPADREKLRWAALVHDVGKLAVAPSLLAKDGRPTDAEWEEIRGHPDAGARMLAPLEPWLGEWLGAATEHHERYDGKGYPRGISGHRISLAGRIVAVADAYDCMTSARSYKKALPASQARFELSRNAGTQFDPDVVRAFLNVSVGRLHLAGGPLAWLASVPGVRDVATGLSGVAASASGAVAATGLAVAAVAASQAPIVPEPAHRIPVVTEVPEYTAAPARATAGTEPKTREAAAAKPERTPSTTTTSSATTTTSTGPKGGGVAVSTTTPVTRPPVTTAPPRKVPPTTAPRPTTTTTTTAPGRTPDLVGETATVRADRRVEVDVLANDSDPDGDLDEESLRIVGEPAIGRARVREGGVIRYDAPQRGAGKQVDIRYRVCDHRKNCAEVVLHVTITS